MIGGVTIEYITTEAYAIDGHTRPYGAGWGFIGAVLLMPTIPVVSVRARMRMTRPVSKVFTSRKQIGP